MLLKLTERGGVQDKIADVINEQVLNKFIYDNESLFNILILMKMLTKKK